jgi:hypothetical protein
MSPLRLNPKAAFGSGGIFLPLASYYMRQAEPILNELLSLSQTW